MMKRLTNILFALALTTGLMAQTAREEIAANKYLAGSNYLDYDNYPATQQLTPAPKGYAKGLRAFLYVALRTSRFAVAHQYRQLYQRHTTLATGPEGG